MAHEISFLYSATVKTFVFGFKKWEKFLLNNFFYHKSFFCIFLRFCSKIQSSDFWSLLIFENKLPQLREQKNSTFKFVRNCRRSFFSFQSLQKFTFLMPFLCRQKEITLQGKTVLWVGAQLCVCMFLDSRDKSLNMFQ